MSQQVYLTPGRFVFWIFAGSTLTWMFWNGVLGMIKYALTGSV
jgi:hypothetical protein